MSKFTVFWRHGRRDVFEGRDIADAFSRAGYGGGAIRVVDFYANGDDKSYTWDEAKHDWVKNTTEAAHG